MTEIPHAFTLQLPNWLIAFANRYSPTTNAESQMEFVINTAQENVQQQTGGPFAAAVFENSSGNLIAVGVNLVLRENLSCAHAEMLALALAQRQVKRYRLNSELLQYSLVTSSEPCAMCQGGICWAGISHLICGATIDDAQAIGFDEGPINDHWQEEFVKRGIKVTSGMLKKDAIEVLRNYQRINGIIYNG